MAAHQVCTDQFLSSIGAMGFDCFLVQFQYKAC
jgi:hypothetical protein